MASLDNPVEHELENIDRLVSELKRALRTGSISLGRMNLTDIPSEIEMLDNLISLDLSYNNIGSKSLLNFVERKLLPSSLEIINLSGNPCADDEEVLTVLQDYAPQLNIIVGIEDDTNMDNHEVKSSSETNGESNIDGEDEGDEDEVDESEESMGRGDVEDELNAQRRANGTLDADAVLKKIVERKIKMESVAAPYDLEQSIQELQKECEGAVQAVGRRRFRFENTPTLQQHQPPDSTSSTRIDKDTYPSKNEDVSPSLNPGASERVAKMIEGSRIRCKETDEFIERLRQKSAKLRDEAFEMAKK